MGKASAKGDHPDQSQFDLFHERPAPPRQRGGIPRHVPTYETRALASRLKAAGETQVAIAKALGIGVTTFERYYLTRNPASQPMGRRRHTPTAATRRAVRRAVTCGMPQAKIARLVGISVPTLRLHYSDELSTKVHP